MIRRLTQARTTKVVDPFTRVSEHFILADFLGNQSVYANGLINSMAQDGEHLTKIKNLGALAAHGLETVMENWGPATISYGYISPDVSQQIVKYQDPEKPSHHRFDLGAAADICVHDFVQGHYKTLGDLYLPDSARSAPIALAYGIDMAGVPYSRLITYSESPYLCLAVSSAEVAQGRPRKAFYENRFTGRPKDKPEYIQLGNPSARRNGLRMLQEQGLDVDWQGAGYPTYHGGGYRQYQHMRVSRYTMVSDWLLSLQSIATGARNVPTLNLDSVKDSFAVAGIVYDWIVRNLEVKRLSIVGAYVSPTNPHFDPENDWREGTIWFDVVPPAGLSVVETAHWLQGSPNGVTALSFDTHVRVSIDTDAVFNDASWD